MMDNLKLLTNYNDDDIHHHNNLTRCLQYDCFGAPLEFSGVQESWWNDRNGVQRYFWAGSNTNNNQHTCQCGIDGNCVESFMKCNCDSAAPEQLVDSGKLD